MEEIIELGADESSNVAELNAMCMYYFETYMGVRNIISLELLKLFLNALSPDFREIFSKNNINIISSKFLINLDIQSIPRMDNTTIEVFVLNKWFPVIDIVEVKNK